MDLYVPVPEDNPIAAEHIARNRQLFADPRLSRDGTIACTSCRNPDRAFSKPAAVSTGIFGRRGKRN